MGAVLEWEAERASVGPKAADDEVAGVGVVAQGHQVGGNLVTVGMVDAEHRGGVVGEHETPGDGVRDRHVVVFASSHDERDAGALDDGSGEPVSLGIRKGPRYVHVAERALCGHGQSTLRVADVRHVETGNDPRDDALAELTRPLMANSNRRGVRQTCDLRIDDPELDRAPSDGDRNSLAVNRGEGSVISCPWSEMIHTSSA